MKSEVKFKIILTNTPSSQLSIRIDQFTHK